MKTIGNRINEFDNGINNTVKKFNDIFFEVPLTGFLDSAIVSIGELTANATTRELTITSVTYTKTLNYVFTKTLQSEKINENTNDDSDLDIDSV